LFQIQITMQTQLHNKVLLFSREKRGWDKHYVALHACPKTRRYKA